MSDEDEELEYHFMRSAVGWVLMFIGTVGLLAGVGVALFAGEGSRFEGTTHGLIVWSVTMVAIGVMLRLMHDGQDDEDADQSGRTS